MENAKPMDMRSIPPQQLMQMKQQLEQEIEHLSSQFARLRAAQQSYVESTGALDKLPSDPVGKRVLVPLSASLYVPGELANTERVLVDIGTGYYAERSVDDAKAYNNRKKEYLATKLSQLQVVVKDKQTLLDNVMKVLELKQVEAVKAAQAAAAASPPAIEG